MTLLAAVLVPFMMAWFAKRPEAAIVLLLAASAVPRLSVEIAGLKAHPEHIISGLMICAAPLLWKKRKQPVAWMLPDYLLMGYVALNFFSSIFASAAPAQTLKWAVQQVLAILPYFWLRLLISDRERLRWSFRALLLAGVACSAYAMLCFYSNVFFGSAFGVEVAQYGDISATYGLQYEANILGAHSGALAVMMLAMYLQERSRKFLIGYALFGLAAMAASLSRAALGATLIGLLLVGFFGLRRHLLNRRVVVSVATASLFAALLVMPLLWQHYAERFSTIEVANPTADPNTLTRTVQTLFALDEVAKHPVFGGGTASFQLAFDWKQVGSDFEEQEGWIGNTELRVLHDTGAAGLIVFSCFVLSLARRGWRRIRAEKNPELVALLASAFVYLISFQATEGTLLAFTWVHLGLIGCAVSFANPEAAKDTGIAPTASAEC